MDTALFQNKYRIKSTRLENWDYSHSGVYSVTICAKDRQSFFGTIENGHMQLSSIGEIVKQYWNKIPKHYPCVTLDEFIIMPNHIHGIIIIDKNHNVETPQWGVSTWGVSTSMATPPAPSMTTTARNTTQTKTGGRNPKWQPNSLGSVINQFKSICTKHIHRTVNPRFQWQSRFYDQIIRNEQSLQRMREYIQNNPARWECDRNNPDVKRLS